MQRSNIEWTNFTSNPLQYRDSDGKVVWACVHASPGCLHCYAEALALRYHRGKLFNVANMKEVTPFLNEDELRHILTYKPASGKMCFLGDMTDIFGEWVSDELLDRLFAVMALRPDVTFQILTKRPERMRQYTSDPFLYQRIHEAIKRMMGYDNPKRPAFNPGDLPLPNVWLGVSVESQDYLHRIDTLKDVPAAVRFVSFEPLLEDLGALILDGIHWAIIGGESGPKARPMHIDWARSILRQCKQQQVAAFMKQAGAKPQGRYDPTLDCGWELIEMKENPSYWMELKNRKGSDMSEWPEDLRVREFPVPQGAGEEGDEFEVIPCADGKARRIKPGLEPLATGVSGRVAIRRTSEQAESAFQEHWYSRVGALKAFGNAIVPQVAAEFIKAYLESLKEHA